MKNVLIAVQHHRSEMSTWLVWGGCDKPQCAAMMCTVTSELAHHTQYVEAQLHNICVCKRVQIYACTKHAQTMVATQWCHQQNPEFQDWCATTWLQQSEWPSPPFLAGDSRPSVRRELQNHDGGWEADSQTGTTDLQEGCSNVDVAGAVVVALTVGQCFSALILEALLPQHAWFKWSAYHLITSLLFGSGGRRVARNWTEKHCSRSNSSCVSSINIITNLEVSVN